MESMNISTPWVRIPLTRELAQTICTWKYDAPYEVYNLPSWETLCSEGWDMASEHYLKTQYHGFLYNGVFKAYGRTFQVGPYIFISIGLAPTVCGNGHGAAVLELLIEEAEHRCPGCAVALEVRTFNFRAIRCYEKMNFQIAKTYQRKTTLDEDLFHLMIRPNN